MKEKLDGVTSVVPTNGIRQRSVTDLYLSLESRPGKDRLYPEEVTYWERTYETWSDRLKALTLTLCSLHYRLKKIQRKKVSPVWT